MADDHYNVLVIGSGPGGATTAARVAETGQRVLLLERGAFLPRERDNWNSEAVFGDTKYTADETFYDRHDRPFRPELHYYVGGNSKVYGAALVRLLPTDFGEVQHPNGIAPAWPLAYQDLEPYYVRAEHLFWVHGQHGEDPFAGGSSQGYPYPPVRHEPRIEQLSDGLATLGLHPFHLPMGVRLTQDAHGRATTDSACIRCDRVDGFPCLLGDNRALRRLCCRCPVWRRDGLPSARAAQPQPTPLLERLCCASANPTAGVGIDRGSLFTRVNAAAGDDHPPGSSPTWAPAHTAGRVCAAEQVPDRGPGPPD